MSSGFLNEFPMRTQEELNDLERKLLDENFQSGLVSLRFWFCAYFNFYTIIDVSNLLFRH